MISAVLILLCAIPATVFCIWHASFKPRPWSSAEGGHVWRITLGLALLSWSSLMRRLLPLDDSLLYDLWIHGVYTLLAWELWFRLWLLRHVNLPTAKPTERSSRDG